MVNVISDFEQYGAFIEKIMSHDYGGLSLQEFCATYKLCFSSFCKLFGKMPPKCDPFSDEYANWEMSFFEFLSGKKYTFESEGSKFDVSWYSNNPPTIDWDLNSRIFIMKSYADFLEYVKPKPGMRVLEMGFGFGNLLELLGRCGCQINGMDASQDCTDYVTHRLKTQNIDSNLLRGSFYDVESMAGEFDLIIFESSFHHCGQPVKLLESLHKKTQEGGRLYFLNDSIYPHVERPWGIVCLGGETAMQIRMNGWLELGYRTDFFEQLLLKTGFKLSNSYTLSNGTVLYEATKNLS